MRRMTNTNSFPYPASRRRVSLIKGEWHDPARGRSIPYKLYLPDGDDTLPLIIWSHGLGGTRDGAGFLARFIAAQGYAHLHIQHDGTDDSLWRDRPDLHPWDAVRQNMPLSWQVVKDRYLDMPFVVAQLKSGQAFNPDILTRFDLDRMGLCGHSFGALSTQIAAGQWTGVSDAQKERFACDDFTTGILYSPSPNIRLTLPDTQIYGDLLFPLLFMTGTRDDSPLKDFDYQDRIAIYQNAGGQDHALMVMNGADHMVYNGSRGQLESYDGIEDHQRQICEASLAWWNAHLKQDEAAKDWLDAGGLEKLTGLETV